MSTDANPAVQRAASVATIVRDPAWLAHRYDPGHDAVHFLKTGADTLRRTAFLIDRELPADLPAIVLGREESVAIAPPPAPLHFIFHSGYCCSTLLARAFDRPGLATALREPTILNDLAGWRRRGDHAARVAPATEDIVRLLARASTPGETVIIKPSNILNAMAAPILAGLPSSRALLLFAPLPVYLGSIARKGMWGALWVREHLLGALQDGIVDLGFGRDALLGQTDLQIAAVGWLAQQALFQKIAATLGPSRVRTIDSETLLARLEPSLAALAGLFGLPLDAEEAAAIARGPVFTSHAKSAAPYDKAARAREQTSLTADRQDEITKVTVWAEAVAKSAGVTLTLGAPLLG